MEFDYKTVIAIKDKYGVKEVICEDNDTRYQTHAVIIAIGPVPQTLEIPGEEQFKANGISWCAICDDAQYREKDAVVILQLKNQFSWRELSTN